MKGLSIFDKYPEKLIYEPSERMKEYWEEHKAINSKGKRMSK